MVESEGWKNIKLKHVNSKCLEVVKTSDWWSKEAKVRGDGGTVQD